MSECFYLGMTTYMREDHYTKERLAVLAEAIPALKGVAETTVKWADYQHVTETGAFNQLRQQMSGMPSLVGNLPQNTPAEYETPQIEFVTIKGYRLVRIYVPSVSEDENWLYEQRESNIMHVLNLLFGDDIISVKTRICSDYYDFASSVESILITTPKNRQAIA